MNRHVRTQRDWTGGRACFSALCALWIGGLAFAQAMPSPADSKAERFDARPFIQAPAKVGAQWKVVRLVHFGARGGIEREFLSCLLAGEGAEQQILTIITLNHASRFPQAFAIAVDEIGQGGVLCEYYEGYASECKIRLTRFRIAEPLYIGADPEGFVDGLYEADMKREAAAAEPRRDGIGRRISSDRIVETEFTMRGADGQLLPLSARRSNDVSLALSAKSISLALRIGVTQESEDRAFTAVFDRATKNWIPTAALSVKPEKD